MVIITKKKLSYRKTVSSTKLSINHNVIVPKKKKKRRWWMDTRYFFPPRTNENISSPLFFLVLHNGQYIKLSVISPPTPLSVDTVLFTDILIKNMTLLKSKYVCVIGIRYQ
jgi:hypothetical protein